MTFDVAFFFDIGLCGFVLFFLIGERFNNWPIPEQALFSGKPIDYIDPLRYNTFYIVYVCTYLTIYIAFFNLGFVVPKEMIPKVFHQITDKLGNQSFTLPALYLFVLLNEKHVGKWDAVWRNRLQQWARITKAVDDIKDSLLTKKDALTPIQQRLDSLQKDMKKLGVGAYWDSVIDKWQHEYNESSLNWHYLKAIYTLNICKELRTLDLIPEDIYRYEKRLHDLARVFPKLDPDNEDISDYVKEINKLFAYFIEGLCKHVVRKNPSKIAQRDFLGNLGFNIQFDDTLEVQIIGVAFKCVVGLMIGCFITILAYMFVMDLAGIEFLAAEKKWLTTPRLIKWTFASVISYSIAIFVSVIIEKSATKKVLPDAITYMTAFLLSSFYSLTFFHLINVRPNMGAYFSLALTMGMIAIPVIRSLTKPTCLTIKEVWVSSSKHAILFGLLVAPFQLLAYDLFRKVDWKFNNPELFITGAYGFTKCFIVTFVVSFLIQESIRRQLVYAQRTAPRAKFRTRLSAQIEDDVFQVTTRNISKGGLLIEPGRSLNEGELILLKFNFGDIQAKVRWVSKKFAGLTFLKECSNIAHLHNYIRDNLGVQYA